MWKLLGGVVIGVFVGAMTFEILKRRHPNLIQQIEDSAERTARSFIDSFKEGYDSRVKRKVVS